MTIYVIPERYSMAAAHGYKREPGVKIGIDSLRGVRFSEGDEVVIIGQLDDRAYEEIHSVRATSHAIPQVTYFPVLEEVAA